MPTTAFSLRMRTDKTSRAPNAENYRDWLNDRTSLTRRLQRICGDAFRLELIAQTRQIPRETERRALALKAGQYALIRHVYLCCGDTPVVFARTVIPAATLTGAGRRLAHLRTRSLGATIFANPRWHSTERWLSRLSRKDALHALACKKLPVAPDTVYGRHTLFRLKNKALLIGEFFLPSLLDLGC